MWLKEIRKTHRTGSNIFFLQKGEANLLAYLFHLVQSGYASGAHPLWSIGSSLIESQGKKRFYESYFVGIKN